MSSWTECASLRINARDYRWVELNCSYLRGKPVSIGRILGILSLPFLWRRYWFWIHQLVDGKAQCRLWKEIQIRILYISCTTGNFIIFVDYTNLLFCLLWRCLQLLLNHTTPFWQRIPPSNILTALSWWTTRPSTTSAEEIWTLKGPPTPT